MHKHQPHRARAARALAPLAAIALLAGCSFIPSHERPAAPVPEAYAQPGSEMPTTAKAAADIDWKEYFTDPRLQTLLGIALVLGRLLLRCLSSCLRWWLQDMVCYGSMLSSSRTWSDGRIY